MGAFGQSMRGSSFVRGGPTSDVERGPKYHYKRFASETPLPDIECWLGSSVIFQGIRTSIVKKPYIFVIFKFLRGGGIQTPVPPPLDPRMQRDESGYHAQCTTNL